MLSGEVNRGAVVVAVLGVLVAGAGRAAPPRSAVIIVRAGKPVDGVDFTLVRATRLHGRVSVGKDRRPAAEVSLNAVIDKGQIPAELRRKDDQTYYAVRMDLPARTDKDGRFEFHLGPGEYQIQGPPRTKPVKVTISAANPPAEIVQDFHVPRPEAGEQRAADKKK